MKLIVVEQPSSNGPRRVIIYACGEQPKIIHTQYTSQNLFPSENLLHYCDIGGSPPCKARPVWPGLP